MAEQFTTREIARLVELLNEQICICGETITQEIDEIAGVYWADRYGDAGSCSNDMWEIYHAHRPWK